MGKDDENILVVDRELFDRLGSFQGLEFRVDRYLAEILAAGRNYFIRRGDAEEDPSKKQLIPYAILTCNGRILHYTRGNKGGEERLHAKGSIGIGGHVNDSDAHPSEGWDASAYHRAVQRELNEELDIQSTYSERIVALLNDDSNPVGQVHLGVIHLFTLDTPNVLPKEEEIANPAFLSNNDLIAKINQMESWSQICVRNLDRLLANPSP